MSKQEEIIDDTKLVIRRTFAAPVEKVYRAWTDPAQLVRWFMPNTRWNAPTIDIESQVGGRHNITMNHSDGDVVHVVGHYVEIVPNERISFTWNSPEMSVGPDASTVTVEFLAVPGGTELTLTHDRLVNTEVRSGTQSGWAGCLDMLAGYLDGEGSAS